MMAMEKYYAWFFFFDRIYWIFWIAFLYLKFPEEILNEQSATPKRETLLSPDLRDRIHYNFEFLIFNFE